MLIDALESNGKLKVAELRALYQSYSNDPRLAQDIAEAVASGDETLEQNGGVLLKDFLESGRDFSEEQWEIVIDSLSPKIHWTCRLNLCHAFVVYPRLLERDKIALSSFLHDAIQDKNAFLRAWAISAFWALADLDSDYADEAMEYREHGLKENAASVCARMLPLERHGNRLVDKQFKRP